MQSLSSKILFSLVIIFVAVLITRLIQQRGKK
jgi:hypothetical protein